MTRTDYEARLRLPLTGNDATTLQTVSGIMVATGYSRIVIGGRGPYVEMLERHMFMTALELVLATHYYYREWRTIRDRVKVYEQRHRVNYADYVPGRFYISPFELEHNGERLIVGLQNALQMELPYG